MKVTLTNIVLMVMIIGAYMVMNMLFSNGDLSILTFLMLLQALTVLVVLSPIAEDILRSLFGCRSVMTEEERQRLMPLFEEVRAEYVEQYPNANRQMELLMDNSMDINAYAMGRKTVAITKGSMQFLSDDQIKGLFAHELGHHCHGDTLIFPLLAVGNIFMWAVMALIKMFEFTMRITNCMVSNKEEHKFMASMFSSLLRASYALITFLISSLVLLNQRGSEYLADEFAFELGYGEGLKDALQMLSRIGADSSGMNLIEKTKASHPDTNLRIARLEEAIAYSADVA